MIRFISVELDGVLAPRISRALWLSMKEFNPTDADEAMARIFPTVKPWKSGNVGEREFWSLAAQAVGCRPEALKDTFLAKFSVDRDVASFLSALSNRYSVGIYEELPPCLQEFLTKSVATECPPPVRIIPGAEAFPEGKAAPDTLYVIATSSLSYTLADFHAQVILFTNLFRLKREIALRGLV